MKVFITGASGYCGREIVRELVHRGHTVRGLSRSEDGCTKVKADGGVPVLGDSNDLDLIKEEAAAAGATIHCAFDHSFTDLPGACKKEQAVIDTVCALYEGTPKILVFTSGTGFGGNIPNFNEDSECPVREWNPRVAAEHLAAKWRTKGVHVVGVRLPIIHGGEMGPGNFWLTPVNAHMKAGYAAIVNGGRNAHVSCHVRDAARLYADVVENPDASGIVHAVAENESVGELYTAAAKTLGIPTKEITAEEAPAHFGWFAMFTQVDAPADAKKTTERLGWMPKEKTILQAVTDGDKEYFRKVDT